MFEQVTGLLAEHEQLQEELADPALHADAARAKRVNRRYAELSKIKAAHEHWKQLGDDLEAARELAKEDEAFAEEIPELERQLAEGQERVRRLRRRAHMWRRTAITVAVAGIAALVLWSLA